MKQFLNIAYLVVSMGSLGMAHAMERSYKEPAELGRDQIEKKFFTEDQKGCELYEGVGLLQAGCRALNRLTNINGQINLYERGELEIPEYIQLRGLFFNNKKIRTAFHALKMKHRDAEKTEDGLIIPACAEVDATDFMEKVKEAFIADAVTNNKIESFQRNNIIKEHNESLETQQKLKGVFRKGLYYGIGGTLLTGLAVGGVGYAARYLFNRDK